MTVTHGTASLYAALETRIGEIRGKTAPRRTSAEFVDFLAQVMASRPLQQRFYEASSDLSQYSALKELTGNRHLNGVISHLKGQAQKEQPFANSQRPIHVANGVLDFNNALLPSDRSRPILSAAIILCCGDATDRLQLMRLASTNQGYGPTNFSQFLSAFSMLLSMSLLNSFNAPSSPQR